MSRLTIAKPRSTEPPSSHQIEEVARKYQNRWWEPDNLKRAAYLQTFEPILLIPENRYLEGIQAILGEKMASISNDPLEFPNPELEREIQKAVLRKRLQRNGLNQSQRDSIEFYLEGKPPQPSGYSRYSSDRPYISAEALDMFSDMKPDFASIIGDGIEISALCGFKEQATGGIIFATFGMRNPKRLNVIIPNDMEDKPEEVLGRYAVPIKVFIPGRGFEKIEFAIGIPSHLKLDGIFLAIRKFISKIQKTESSIGLVSGIKQQEAQEIKKTRDPNWINEIELRENLELPELS